VQIALALGTRPANETIPVSERARVNAASRRLCSTSAKMHFLLSFLGGFFLPASRTHQHVTGSRVINIGKRDPLIAQDGVPISRVSTVGFWFGDVFSGHRNFVANKASASALLTPKPCRSYL
jgi:hypothetical protein